MILVLMTAVNCGVSAVAVHRRRRHICHGALADSHFVEFLQLQYIDTVIDDCCAAPAVWVQMWRSSSSSHSCNVDAGDVAHMPVVASTGAWDGRDSAVHCGGSAVGTHRLACFFRAVYTGTRPGFPRHQGGEGVAGTPGACSQVFCHPIRCI